MEKLNDIQNRHEREGWEGLEKGWRVTSPFTHLGFFIFSFFLLPVGITVNYILIFYSNYIST